MALPPMLPSRAESNRHLREYFGEAGPGLAKWLQFALPYMPDNGFAGRLLAKAARNNAERLARRFIAGSNLTEALEAIARLRRRSLGFTVDLLGEATITEVEAERYQQEYFQLIDGLTRHVNTWEPIDLIDRDQRGPMPRVNVSVKLSSLYTQFDPIDPGGTFRALADRLRPILSAPRRSPASLNSDIDQYAYKDITLRIFREILEEPEYRD